MIVAILFPFSYIRFIEYCQLCDINMLISPIKVRCSERIQRKVRM